jgi:hypothetical protein
MRYKPRSIAALQIALGGFPDTMRVEADQDIGVSAKTVGELRKITTWPENLAITTRGLRPRPAHVSDGLSGLRYLGATEPRAPPRPTFARRGPPEKPPSFKSSDSTARRCSVTFDARAASTWSLSFTSLSIDIVLRATVLSQKRFAERK